MDAVTQSEQLSPYYHLVDTHIADEGRVTTERLEAVRAHQRMVWNALIPASAVSFCMLPHGVAYLHPRKGWKSVGRKRFAVRGHEHLVREGPQDRMERACGRD